MSRTYLFELQTKERDIYNKCSWHRFYSGRCCQLVLLSIYYGRKHVGLWEEFCSKCSQSLASCPWSKFTSPELTESTLKLAIEPTFLHTSWWIQLSNRWSTSSLSAPQKRYMIYQHHYCIFSHTDPSMGFADRSSPN